MDTKKLRQKILDLAIRGKLVPQDPNDEPASVLLERIRAEKERLIKEGKIKRSKKSAKSSDTPHYENVPFKVPDSWEWCQVEDIFELNPKNDVSDDTPSGFIPMISVEDGFGYSHTFETKPWGTIKKGYSHFQNGDIGIAKISPCFENRKSTIFYNLPNGIGAGTTELTVLRGNCVNNEFYLYLFQSAWYLFEGTKEFKGVVGQQRVNKEIFTTLLVPLPPLEEQGRIVAEIKQWFSSIDILDDDKTDLNITIQKTKSKIIELAIHGKLVPQNPNDEPAIDMLKRINPSFVPCDKEHYENVPQNWAVCKVKDVFRINPKTKADDDMEAGFVPMSNIQDSFKNSITFEPRTWGSIKKGYTNFEDGDIVVAKISPCLENRKSAIIVGLPNGIGAGTTELNVFRSDYVHPLYGLFFFKSDYFISQCVGTFNGVVGQQRVSTKIIEDMVFLVPPRPEQERIINKVNELFQILDNISANL